MASSTPNIGLTLPATNEKITITPLNTNATRIDTAIGELGTPSASNNLVKRIDKENYNSTVGSGASFAEALAAVTYNPYANAASSVKTIVQNMVTAAATYVEDELTGSGVFTFGDLTSTGSGTNQRYGGIVVRSGVNLYHGYVLSTSTGITVQFRKVSASSYYVKIIR